MFAHRKGDVVLVYDGDLLHKSKVMNRKWSMNGALYQVNYNSKTKWMGGDALVEFTMDTMRLMKSLRAGNITEKEQIMIGNIAKKKRKIEEVEEIEGMESPKKKQKLNEIIDLQSHLEQFINCIKCSSEESVYKYNNHYKDYGNCYDLESTALFCATSNDCEHQIKWILNMKTYENEYTFWNQEVGQYSLGKIFDINVDYYNNVLDIKIDVYEIIKWVSIFGLIHYVGTKNCSIDKFIDDFVTVCNSEALVTSDKYLYGTCEIECAMGNAFDDELKRATNKFDVLVDEMITFGYCKGVKQNLLKQQNIIPSGIAKIIYRFYHEEWFIK